VASRAERTLALGRFGTVEYAVRTDGTMEAKQWFDSQGAEVLASFGVLFQRLVDEGRIFNKTQFRPLQDEVWEFKRGDHRILCYRMGNRSLLTHRIKKAGGLVPQVAIDRPSQAEFSKLDFCRRLPASVRRAEFSPVARRHGFAGVGPVEGMRQSLIEVR
jgi:hypothetical protein